MSRKPSAIPWPYLWCRHQACQIAMPAERSPLTSRVCWRLSPHILLFKPGPCHQDSHQAARHRINHCISPDEWLNQAPQIFILDTVCVSYSLTWSSYRPWDLQNGHKFSFKEMGSWRILLDVIMKRWMSYSREEGWLEVSGRWNRFQKEKIEDECRRLDPIDCGWYSVFPLKTRFTNDETHVSQG